MDAEVAVAGYCRLLGNIGINYIAPLVVAKLVGRIVGGGVTCRARKVIAADQARVRRSLRASRSRRVVRLPETSSALVETA
ncbi:hypothetical protein [Streptomyces sp. Rer75]|uniref:hypothetical protein n=1 Tax=unclassified Streptomyces TaxID=2593676 RepID=UPI0015CFF097|nr:hypothetical protein [Streptomyces sp. Rer75]QLH19272.1 hypothetical protein HYQ63_36315 [Streptomyces sp. Rer75]